MKFRGRFRAQHMSNLFMAPVSRIKTFFSVSYESHTLIVQITVRATQIASLARVCTQATGLLPSLQNEVPMNWVKLKCSTLITSHNPA